MSRPGIAADPHVIDGIAIPHADGTKHYYAVRYRKSEWLHATRYVTLCALHPAHPMTLYDACKLNRRIRGDK